MTQKYTAQDIRGQEMERMKLRVFGQGRQGWRNMVNVICGNKKHTYAKSG